MKNPELHENSDGGYLIPGDMYHDPIYTPLWPNWVGRLLLRWFRIRDKSKDTTMEKVLMERNQIAGRAMDQSMK